MPASSLTKIWERRGELYEISFDPRPGAKCATVELDGVEIYSTWHCEIETIAFRLLYAGFCDGPCVVCIGSMIAYDLTLSRLAGIVPSMWEKPITSEAFAAMFTPDRL
jgi:hypothetical protein